MFLHPRPLHALTAIAGLAVGINAASAAGPSLAPARADAVAARDDALRNPATAQTVRLVVRHRDDESRRAAIVQERLTRGVRDTSARRLDTHELDRLCAVRSEQARARLAPSRVRTLGAFDAEVIEVPLAEAERVLAELRASGDYAWVTPDVRLMPAQEADDPLFAQQYHHAPDQLNTVEAWLYTTGDPSVVVAVLDSGIDTDHPDLPLMTTGYNAVTKTRQDAGGSVEDTDGHGTAVLGAAAAAGSNGIGITGAGWHLTAMPVKVASEDDGSATVADIIDGAMWAAQNGARVVNSSYEGADLEFVGDLGTTLRDMGVLLVWASGNSGQPRVPIDHLDTIIVGATDENQNQASFSAFGPGVDIVAPGVQILTTAVGGGTERRNGTSFAAPLVSGTLALIWSADPTLPADTVEQILIDTATDLRTPGRDTRTGWGLANAGAAVAQAASGQVSMALPLVETFAFDRLDRNVWVESSGWSIAMPTDAPAGDSTLRLTSNGARVASREIDATNATPDAMVRVFASASDRRSGRLAVRYTDASGAWRTLAELPAVDHARFIPAELPLPEDARHGAVRFEIETVGAKSLTQWLVDDVRVGPNQGITLPWRETFEDEPDAVLKWAQFDAGRATTPLVPSGRTAGTLASASVITTHPMRLEHFINRVGFDISAAWFVRPDGAPAGATATLEYSTDGGQTWLQLDGVTATGDDGLLFERRVIGLPFLVLFNETIQLRVRASGEGAWLVDDVQLTEVPPAEPRCRADVNGDGMVSNMDVNLFVRSWIQGDPLADVLVDGFIDMGDIQTFLDWATLGCP